MTVARGNVAILKLFLEHVAKKQDKQVKDIIGDIISRLYPTIGTTMLHAAVQYGQKDQVMLRRLLPHARNIHVADKTGATVLHDAVTMKRTECARLILEEDKKRLDAKKPETSIVYTKNTGGRTALYLAAANDNQEMMQLLIDYEAQINPGNHKAAITTLLQEAMHAKKDGVVRFLLMQYKADPNIPSKDGVRALHIAAYLNNVPLAELLVQHGAQPCNIPCNAEGNDGLDPLHFAAEFGHLETLKYFIETLKVDVNSIATASSPAREKHGATPLLLATVFRHEGCAEFLIDHGADTKLQINGDSLLHAAAIYGWKTIVEKLIGKGFDINKANMFGFTPLILAELSEHEQTAKVLRYYGATIGVEAYFKDLTVETKGAEQSKTEKDFPNLTFNGHARNFINTMTALEADIISPGLKQLNDQDFRNAEALNGQFKDCWKLRKGDYRIVYHIDSATKKIMIITIDSRKTVYKHLKLRD